MALFTRNQVPQVTPTEENQVFVANTDRHPVHVTLELSLGQVFGLTAKFMFAALVLGAVFAIPIAFVLIGTGVIE